MKLKLALATLFTAFGLNAIAQTEKTALKTMPAVSVTPDSTAKASLAENKAAENKTVAPLAKKVSYTLSAGAGFSNFGNYSYISPSVFYRLSPKWSVFSSLTYINSNFTAFAGDSRQPMATKNYLLHAGATYDVSDKLRLSGSVWRDFSGATNQFGNNGLRQPAIYGTEFHARYKINEHLSVSGGFRTSNGNYYSPYNSNSYYSPSPFLGF